MKKLHLIVFTILGIVYNSASMAQSKPDIKFSTETKPVDRTAEDQEINLTIKYNRKPANDSTYKITIVAEQEPQSTTNAFKADCNPCKLVFGKLQPTTQIEKIILLKDTKITLPVLIKVTMRDSANNEIDKRLIFYNPAGTSQKTTDPALLKSTEDIKADIATLKTQILDGDTSKTYIGKFVIRSSSKVVPPSVEITKFDLDSKFENAPRQLSANGQYKREITAFVSKTKQTAGENKSVDVVSKDIATVIITVKEGEIEFIKVKMTDSSYFINLRSPIPLLTIEKRFNDKLTNPIDGSYIYLKDAINFEVDKRFNYFPVPGTYYLNNNKTNPKNEMKMFSNNGLNSYVDLRVFTDLFGALDNKANGLLQVEGKAKVFLNRGNIKNTFGYYAFAVEPYLGISKFDSKYDTLKITNVKDTINRMNLYQRSFIKVGIKFDLLRFDFRPANSIYFNAGYQFNAGNISIRDYKNKADSVVSTAILNTPYLEMGFTGNIGPNFGFDGDARLMFQQLNVNKYFTNSGFNRIMAFSVTGFFYPGSKSKDTFFLRFSDNLNYADRREDFYQLQFGYSFNFKF